MGHDLIIYNIFSFTLVYKSQITITKCSQDKSKQELESESSFKVGHKVGHIHIFPKVSPIADSPKRFINSP